MSEKTLKTRIIHKHDVESNWLKATSFIPKQGELIVYDIDDTHTYERFKIGDGKTVVSELPFASNLGALAIEVDELPTDNVDDSQIYIVNEKVNAELYYFNGIKYCTLAEVVLDIVGVNPTINSYVVDELPTNAEITDLQTFNVINCYFYNDVAYIYGNAGSGNMWLTVNTIFAQMGNPTEDRGRVYDLTDTSVEVGLYVYYEELQKSYIYSNNEWKEIAQINKNKAELDTSTDNIWTGRNEFNGTTNLKNNVFIGDVDDGESGHVNFFTETVTFNNGTVTFENGADGDDNGGVFFNGKVDFTNANVTGLSSGGSEVTKESIETAVKSGFSMKTQASNTSEIKFVSSGYEESQTFSATSYNGTTVSNKLKLEHSSSSYGFPLGTLSSDNGLGSVKGFVAKSSSSTLGSTTYDYNKIVQSVQNGSSTTSNVELTFPSTAGTLATQEWINEQDFGSGSEATIIRLSTETADEGVLSETEVEAITSDYTNVIFLIDIWNRESLAVINFEKKFTYSHGDGYGYYYTSGSYSLYVCPGESWQWTLSASEGGSGGVDVVELNITPEELSYGMGSLDMSIINEAISNLEKTIFRINLGAGNGSFDLYYDSNDGYNYNFMSKEYLMQISTYDAHWYLSAVSDGGGENVDTSNLVDLTSEQVISGKKVFESLALAASAQGISWSEDLMTNQVDLSGATLVFNTGTLNNIVDMPYFMTSGGYMLVGGGGGSQLDILDSSSTSIAKIYSNGWNGDSFTLPNDFGFITTFIANNAVELLNETFPSILLAGQSAAARITFDADKYIEMPEESGTVATREWVEQNVSSGGSVDTSNLVVEKVTIKGASEVIDWDSIGDEELFSSWIGGKTLVFNQNSVPFNEADNLVLASEDGMYELYVGMGEVYFNDLSTADGETIYLYTDGDWVREEFTIPADFGTPSLFEYSILSTVCNITEQGGGLTLNDKVLSAQESGTIATKEWVLSLLREWGLIE